MKCEIVDFTLHQRKLIDLRYGCCACENSHAISMGLCMVRSVCAVIFIRHTVLQYRTVHTIYTDSIQAYDKQKKNIHLTKSRAVWSMCMKDFGGSVGEPLGKEFPWGFPQVDP